MRLNMITPARIIWKRFFCVGDVRVTGELIPREVLCVPSVSKWLPIYFKIVEVGVGFGIGNRNYSGRIEVGNGNCCDKKGDIKGPENS